MTASDHSFQRMRRKRAQTRPRTGKASLRSFLQRGLRAALTAAVVSVAGCASHPMPQHSGPAGNGYSIDQSIIVPDERSALASGLRRALAERGWRLDHYGNETNRGRDHAAMARRATYRLTLTNTRIGPCRNGEPGFHYRIAIIENIGGAVPVALAGVDCLQPILAEFSADLDQRRLHSSSADPGAASDGTTQ